MGKGGGGDTTSTVTQSSIPAFAEPYFHQMMARTMSEANRPYQPYTQQRIASQTPQTIAGMNMAQQYAQSGSPYLNNANSLANMVGQQAMDYQNYEAGGVHNTYQGPEQWDAAKFAADQVGFGQGGLDKMTAAEFDAAQRDKYTSPYQAAVTEAAQAETARNAAQEQAMIKANQATTGAFGGSRGAVQQQIAANAAQQRISDIGVQGRQAAFENAQQQFERDQQRNMQAQGANQQTALQSALANQKANLEALGMGEQSRQFGYELGEKGRQIASQLGMQAETSTEELRQGGKKLGLAGLQIASGTAGQLADFQKLSDSMQLSRIQSMLGVGQMGQDYQQQLLDMDYNDFLNQQNWPVNRIGLISSTLSSQPQGQNTSTTQTTPSNPVAGAMGSLLGYQALQNLGRGTQ